MKRARTVTVLGIVVLSVAGFVPLAGIAGSAAAGPVADPVCEDRTPHPPIRIAEDHGPEGFTWTNPVTGADEHRPGSGVVAGDGTADDPYVISGWCISSTPPGKSSAELLEQAGILLEGTDAHVVVEDTKILSATGAEEIRPEVEASSAGIEVSGSANVTLSDNDILMSDVGTGIVVAGSDGIEIAWNDVTGGQVGISIRNSDDARIADNEAEGIRLEGSADARLARNLVTDQGVELLFAPRVAVVDNTVTGADGYGIAVGYGNRPELIDNTVTGNGISDDGTPTGDGILFEGTEDVEIRGNVISGNGFDGVSGAANGVTLVDNEIRDNGDEGAELSGLRDSTVTDNVIVDNRATAIDIVDGRNVTVARNLVRNSLGNGVFVGISEDVDVVNNTASGNTFDGINVRRSTGVNVVHNTVRDSGRDGVIVWKESAATVEANDIAGSGDDGVALLDLPGGPGLKVADNNLDGNGNEGLSADNVTEAVDATGNWWGDDTGPSGGILDACTGTPADGDGAAIDAVDADVCFDPWRTSPNPDAGAS